VPTLAEIFVTPWKDVAFRSYAIYTALAWISYTLMGPFLWPYCLGSVKEGRLGLSLWLTNLFLFILPLLGNAWVAPFWGRAIDRFGPRPVLAASSLAACFMPLVWVVMRPELIWLIPVQCFIGGLCWPGIERVFDFMLLKGFPETRRTTYIATFNVVVGLAIVVGTALGGAYAAFWQSHTHLLAIFPSWVTHYHPLFLTSTVLRLLVFLLVFPRLRLDGTARTRTVARDVATGVTAALGKVASPRKKARSTAK